MLTGKWVWIWQWSACDGGNLDTVANRLKGAGCAGAFVKAGDGGHGFEQSIPVPEIIAGLQARGVGAIPWFYWYLADEPAYLYGVRHFTWEEEADQLIGECIRCGAQAAIIDVEGESENAANPTVNARLALSRVKQRLSALELYYAPLAQPTYHPRLPYAAFSEFCEAILPQAYHNAMQVPPRRAVELCYSSFAAVGLMSRPLLPAGGTYGSVTGAEIEEWAAACIERGARALSFWSFQHMNGDLWRAVGRVEIPEEDEVDKTAREAAEAAQKKADANAYRERIAGLILSGDGETAYRETQLLRKYCGLPLTVV